MASHRNTKSSGFGLLELVVTLVIAGLLAALALPAYDQYSDRAKTAHAIGDIGSMSVAIDKFRLNNNDALPGALSDLPIEIPLDPWGRPYRYLNIEAAGPGNAAVRKDKNLVPLNSDFDLYSMGKDGATAAPLTAKASRDDILRANDGAFVGRGEDY